MHPATRIFSQHNGLALKLGALAAAVGLAGAGWLGTPAASEATQYFCDGKVVTIHITSRGTYNGTNGNDVILADVPVWETGVEIHGLDGDDTICGSMHADTLLGGLGKDTIFGNDGDDCIGGDSEAGCSDDVMTIFGNDDELHGGDGNDDIYGQIGDDKMWGDAGADDIYGGDGGDTAWGGSGNDDIWGWDPLESTCRHASLSIL